MDPLRTYLWLWVIAGMVCASVLISLIFLLINKCISRKGKHRISPFHRGSDFSVKSNKYQERYVIPPALPPPRTQFLQAAAQSYENLAEGPDLVHNMAAYKQNEAVYKQEVDAHEQEVDGYEQVDCEQEVDGYEQVDCEQEVDGYEQVDCEQEVDGYEQVDCEQEVDGYEQVDCEQEVDGYEQVDCEQDTSVYEQSSPDYEQDAAVYEQGIPDYVKVEDENLPPPPPPYVYADPAADDVSTEDYDDIGDEFQGEEDYDDVG